MIRFIFLLNINLNLPQEQTNYRTMPAWAVHKNKGEHSHWLKQLPTEATELRALT